MSKQPKNLTLQEKILGFADEIMELRGFDTLTGLVEDLIRTEYEKRLGPLTIKETPPPYGQTSSETLKGARKKAVQIAKRHTSARAPVPKEKP